MTLYWSEKKRTRFNYDPSEYSHRMEYIRELEERTWHLKQSESTVNKELGHDDINWIQEGEDYNAIFKFTTNTIDGERVRMTYPYSSDTDDDKNVVAVVDGIVITKM